MLHDPQPTRRRILIGLAVLLPPAEVLRSSVSHAGASEDDFLWASRIIAGTGSLSPDISTRIQHLLATRIAGFEASLTDLVTAMRAAGGDRAATLAGLTGAQVAFALEIAKPWYVGYVGTPSSFVLKDDATFATFLQAQSWEKIVGEVPRITFPNRGAAWWDSTPAGVTPPPMPEGIRSWTFRPAGPPAIVPPDPAWKSYAIASHASIEAARKAKPGDQ